MSDAAGAELRALMRSDLLQRLTRDGWGVDEVAEALDGEVIGAFRQRVADEFCVTAQFEFDIEDRRGRSSITVTAGFGLSYDRSYRLWPTVSGHPFLCEAGLDDELNGAGKLAEVRIGHSRDVAAAAARLDIVATRAVQLARRYATVDGLLGCLRSAKEDFDQDMVVPVVLAAAGRHDEARATITTYRSRARSASDREFALRLTNWMDSGSELPDPPAAADVRVRADDERYRIVFPRGYEDRLEAPSVVDIMRRSRDRSARRRAASDAVRSQKSGKSREQLLAMYQLELEERDLEMDPLTIELELDGIQAETRAEKRRVG